MPLKDVEARREYHRAYMAKRLEDPEYRAAHHARVKRNNDSVTADVRQLISDFRATGCLICEETEAVCLSAHHVDSDNKEFNLGDAVRERRSRSAVATELSKCVCICHNCHAKLHAGLIILPTIH